MLVRKSTYEDIPQLMLIYRESRQIMLDSGDLHQWAEGYPPEELIRQDIDRGVGYAIELFGLVVGAFTFIPGEDPTYKVIEGGAWKDDSRPYCTIHRLGSLKSVHGIAKACFDWCWAQTHNLRIDTHEDNVIMRHCIEKAGFEYCGIIHLLNGNPRMAFQKSATAAKINLGLRVLGKRQDGFHELETLFLPYYGFGDRLHIEQSDILDIDISPCNWNPQEDLTVRAWKMLHEEFSIPPVRIRLEKGTPVGAGLGGGSADAAAALRILNGLFNLGLSDAELAVRAARLGSDCAFFIYEKPMFGTGRGEVLEPFDIDLSDYDIRLELPEGVCVSTAEAYKGVLAARNKDTMPLREALSCPVEQWKDVLVNDFETTVFPSHPEIERLKQSFYDDGAVYAAMSGSGSAVFGLWRKL